MLHEFAVEPEVLSDWRTVQLLRQSCGVEHGRLIARYPKKWKRKVYDACRVCGDVERKRIEAWLGGSLTWLFPSRREYDAERGWLENAESEQTGDDPFRAIVADANPRDRDDVLLADEIGEPNGRWYVPSECIAPRTVDGLVSCAFKLLQISRRVRIVDPYFDPQQARFRKVFWAFVVEACKGIRLSEDVQVHACADTRISGEEWQRRCEEYLPGGVPAGITVRLIRWGHLPGGDRLHARYVLTELGGIRFDYGTDTYKDSQEETTDVSLVDPGVRDSRWNQLEEVDPNDCSTKPAFQKVDDVEITGTGSLPVEEY